MKEILIISTVAGLATGLGGLIVIIAGNPNVKTLSLALGLAAGINIVVATTELLPASIEHGSMLLMTLGFVLGIVIMSFTDRLLPSANLVNSKFTQDESRLMRMGYVIALGLAIHNMPEGLAIGAGFEAAPDLGTIIAAAIAAHNVPEGIGVAVPLRMAGVSWRKILLTTCLTGLATPVGTLLGMMLFSAAKEFVSLSLAFGGGAIVYVVAKELIPESNKQHAQYAICGISAGILLTMILACSDLL